MKNSIRKWTDKLEGKWETILISLCEVVVGILLLVRPLKFTAGIIVAAGLFCIVLGLKYGWTYFRTDIIRASAERDLFRCLLLAGSGMFLVFGSGWLSATQTVLDIVYGVALMVLSAEKIQWSVNLLRWQKPYWYVTGINAVVTIVMSILMLLNPFPNQIIWIVIGLALVVEAILDIVAIIFADKKTIVHPVNTPVTTASATENEWSNQSPEQKDVGRKKKKQKDIFKKKATKEENVSVKEDAAGDEKAANESVDEIAVQNEQVQEKPVEETAVQTEQVQVEPVRETAAQSEKAQAEPIKENIV